METTAEEVTGDEISRTLHIAPIDKSCLWNCKQYFYASRASTLFLLLFKGGNVTGVVVEDMWNNVKNMKIARNGYCGFINMGKYLLVKQQPVEVESSLAMEQSCK